jgi:hypothetical protein
VRWWCRLGCRVVVQSFGFFDGLQALGRAVVGRLGVVQASGCVVVRASGLVLSWSGGLLVSVFGQADCWLLWCLHLSLQLSSLST